MQWLSFRKIVYNCKCDNWIRVALHLNQEFPLRQIGLHYWMRLHCFVVSNCIFEELTGCYIYCPINYLSCFRVFDFLLLDGCQSDSRFESKISGISSPRAEFSHITIFKPVVSLIWTTKIFADRSQQPKITTPITKTYFGNLWRGHGTNLKSCGADSKKLKTCGIINSSIVLLKWPNIATTAKVIPEK